ncbi:MAG: hypothetical protein KKB51_14020 [Candidatus Riflebacteria bacterium]|nr:hypothetical protein [Candidatus Riflebacteria bacterium]
MQKYLLSAFLIAALLLLPGQSKLFAASYGLNVIENDSIGVIYFNLGKAYNVLREQVNNFDKTADENTKQQIEQVIKSLPADSPLGKDLSVAKIKEILDKWHSDAVFIPTGGVWISVSNDLKPKIVIEAQIKLDKLAELLKSAPPAKDMDLTPKNNVIKFEIPGMDQSVEISSERIVIGDVSATPAQLNESWQPYFKRVSSPDQHLSVELDVQAIIQKVLSMKGPMSGGREKACAANMRVMLGAVEMYNMDNTEMMHELNIDPLVKDKYLKSAPVCPDGGTYSAHGDLVEDGQIACSIHNTVEDLKKYDGPAKPEAAQDYSSQLPDPRIKHIVRARIFADTAGLLLAVAVDDEPIRQQFKEMLQQSLKMLEEQAAQNKADARTETIKKMFASLTHVDRAPWLGVSIKQSENEQMLVGTAVVGIMAAIAIPNFKKARFEAQKKACFANQRVLMGATEMYNMDNEKMLSEVNIEALLNGKYLKSAPVCPQSGTYSAIGDLAGEDGKITCSEHGSVE